MNGRFWLQRFMWLFDLSQYVRAFGALLFVSAFVERGWTLFEASGRTGSPGIFLSLLGTGALMVGLLLLLTGSLRWTLLYIAVKSYVSANIKLHLSAAQCLVGIGPGGAIAVGLVAKVLRELGFPPPPIVVFDMAYTKQGSNPVIGSLWPSPPTIEPARAWIIQGNVNGGRSLQALRDKYDLHEAPVFAFVISATAELRENVDHFMAIGSRNILPWPTEKP